MGNECSFSQIISVHFTLTTKESTIPSRGVNQCMKSSCKKKKQISFAGGSWLALNRELNKATSTATAAITSLEKWSRAAFKFYRAYSISFNSSNVGIFF